MRPYNYRAPLDAASALCLHRLRHRRGASERGRWAKQVIIAFTQLILILAMGSLAFAEDDDEVARKIVHEVFKGRTEPPKQTLEQKVNASGLIVFGTASAFGGTSSPVIQDPF